MSTTSMLSDQFEVLDVAAAAGDYAAAQPFPHAVLDGLLDPTMLGEAIDAFPAADDDGWTHYLHVNERKHGHTHMDQWPGPIQALATTLMSDRFVTFLEQLTGISGLLADPAFDGGGLHRSERGGYLNIHADFSKHHVRRDWKRRVNVLVYLNDEWDDAWGGQLELWDQAMTECVHRVSPRANRMVVFTTTATSYHGHPEPLGCPPGTARKSLALYYFTPGSADRAETTHYRSRPTDGWKRAAIYLDGKVLRAYDVVKRRTGMGDRLISRVLGSLRSRRGRRS